MGVVITVREISWHHWKWWPAKPQSTGFQSKVVSKERQSGLWSPWQGVIPLRLKLEVWEVFSSLSVSGILGSSTQLPPGALHSRVASKCLLYNNFQISLKMTNIKMPMSIGPYFFNETLGKCHRAPIQPSGPLLQIFTPKLYVRY